jgi:nicotinate-nucleotide--dimethylbenzimidazole phosphoribosyltransferase
MGLHLQTGNVASDGASERRVNALTSEMPRSLKSGKNLQLPSKPPSPQPALRQRVQQLLDQKTKPQGSLGRLEALALQLALIQNTEVPALHQPQLVVFAADHGVAKQGVSAYPQAVTQQMVLNFLAGGAAVAVLARQHGLQLTVMDCGVAHHFSPQPGLVVAKVPGAEHGSADSSSALAMSAAQCEAAIQNGMQAVKALPGNALLLGEMGIGNTSAASLLMARLTGEPLATCVGRGTGLDDAGLARKLTVLERALQTHSRATTPLPALAALGGLEIATMVGAVLQAASERRVVLVDGFITTAAVAVAAALESAVLPYCVFAHCSAESGHARWLAHLGVQPLLDLSLRLGEGSGAALAWPLLPAACAILNEMASFESAGVSQRSA